MAFDAWSIVGVDPDVNGALIVLSGPTAGDVETQLFFIDCPTKPTQVNRKTRNRHDPNAMSIHTRTLQLPCGTAAYLEQGGTRPSFGAQRSYKQGEGVGYWHGVLVGEGLDVRLVVPKRWKTALGLPARDKVASLDMARELCRELWPMCPDLQDAFKLKKHHGRAEAFLITAYGHASEGDPHGRLRERDALSTSLARVVARREMGDEPEPSEPAPATPLATTAPPEAALRVTPATWTGPLGTEGDPITIDIDIAQ